MLISISGWALSLFSIGWGRVFALGGFEQLLDEPVGFKMPGIEFAFVASAENPSVNTSASRSGRLKYPPVGREIEQKFRLQC
jgi:hypothetical protein